MKSPDFNGVNELLINFAFFFGNAHFNPTESSAFTLSLWVCPHALILSTLCSKFTTPVVVANAIGWKLEMGLGGGLTYTAQTNSLNYRTVTTAIPLTANRFNHVVITQDTNNNATSNKIYINGVDVSTGGTQVGTPAGIVATADFKIGAHETSAGANGNWYSGHISELSYWLTEMTPQEVLELYNGGEPYALDMHSKGIYLDKWLPLTHAYVAFGIDFWPLDDIRNKTTYALQGINMTKDDLQLSIP